MDFSNGTNFPNDISREFKLLTVQPKFGPRETPAKLLHRGENWRFLTCCYIDFSSVLKYDMPAKPTGVGLPNHSCPNQLDTTAAVDAGMTKDSPTSFGMASIQGVKKNGKHAYLVGSWAFVVGLLCILPVQFLVEQVHPAPHPSSS